MKKLYNGKIFYGWFIVAAAFIIMACSFGIFYNTASLFLKPVSEDLSISRSAVSATLTIRSIIQMIISLLSGKIFTKYNLRNVMKLSTLVLLVSFFSYAFVGSLLAYYMITIIASISFSLMSILPLSLILNNWFNDRIGTVTGIAFMGSGIGVMIFNSLAGKWILLYGWRISYIILGLIMLITLIPCIFLIIRIHPRDIGLESLGGYIKNISDKPQEEEGVMLNEVVKTGNFMALILCTVLFSMCINTLTNTIAPHLTDIGYTTTYAANIVAICMGAIALGKIILGYLYDKLGVRIGTVIASFATVLGLISLTNFNNLFLILLVIATGVGCSYGTVGPPIITQQLFGKRDYSSIYGVVYAANAIGGAIGPFINGIIYDLDGNYLLAFKVMTVVAFFNMIAYIFVLPKKRGKRIIID